MTCTGNWVAGWGHGMYGLVALVRFRQYDCTMYIYSWAVCSDPIAGGQYTYILPVMSQGMYGLDTLVRFRQYEFTMYIYPWPSTHIPWPVVKIHTIYHTGSLTSHGVEVHNQVAGIVYNCDGAFIYICNDSTRPFTELENPHPL